MGFAVHSRLLPQGFVMLFKPTLLKPMPGTARLFTAALPFLLLLLTVLALGIGGCEGLGSKNGEDSPTAQVPTAQASPQAQATGDATVQAAAQGIVQNAVPVTVPGTVQTSPEPVIVALGDSLTAGFGLPAEENFPSLLQEKLRAGGYPHRMVNAGVSGDTSAGALARLDWVFRQRVDLLIVALGGNDGLRGLSTEAMEENLTRIVTRAQAQGARVLLAGLEMPSNYGPAYQKAFREVYPAVAKKSGAALLPFLLQGVAADPALNQADRIHPNTEGTRIVAAHVWQALEPLLSEGG